MAGYLTTHVLDTARGLPAAGIKITLYRMDGGQSQKIAEAVTNADGRTDTPILAEAEFELGTYELIFECGAYLREHELASGDVLFLDAVPIRFGLSEDAHFHVPLLLSPYGYSTYRGS